MLSANGAWPKGYIHFISGWAIALLILTGETNAQNSPQTYPANNPTLTTGPVASPGGTATQKRSTALRLAPQVAPGAPAPSAPLMDRSGVPVRPYSSTAWPSLLSPAKPPGTTTTPTFPTQPAPMVNPPAHPLVYPLNPWNTRAVIPARPASMNRGSDNSLLPSNQLPPPSPTAPTSSPPTSSTSDDLLSPDVIDLGGNSGRNATSNSPNNSADELLGPANAANDNPLEAMGQQAPGRASDSLPGAGHGQDTATRANLPAGVDPHADAFADTLYPSALRCAKCHQKIYDEWRVSAHAYAAISPMFQRFEQAMTLASKGTVGYFCVRCHAPVATQMEYPREASIADGAAVFREGITCVACHRVVERYGRVNGERRIEPGDIFQPVVGNLGGTGIARVAADADNYKVKLHPGDKRPGQELHKGAIQFEQLAQSSFCVSCHQVAVHPGIALEVVWAQYRASPANARGVTCQDCHMGIEPGKALGYSCGPAAEMSGKVVDSNRKHSNHIFHGPGNSIAHPGLFPHNEKSLRWSIEQWLEFEWRAGWGTPEFEKQLASTGNTKSGFPNAWQLVDDRRDARKIIDDNFKLLAIKRESAVRTMNNAAHIEGPLFQRTPKCGEDLQLKYRIHNTSDGHNMPTGSLGAQPQLWLNVVLTGPDGRWLWESGYLDGNGDLADMHSLQVRKGLIKPDLQLTNLQTKFLITGVKGTDREMYLPVNVDIDQLPFLRPGAVPVSVLNHPPFIRMEAHSVPPLGFRVADYRIPGELIRRPGTYRLSARMRSRMEPIYFMRFCTATPEMERRMLEQTLDVQPQSVEFEIH